MTQRYDSIRPGEAWLDTTGARIQAHGGSILYHDDAFYWYGENKERTATDTGIGHWGVRCYRSTDLCNWDDVGLIVPPEPEDEECPLHPQSMVDFRLSEPLRETFTFDDIESEELVMEGITVTVATPSMLYRMKGSTVRPQDRVDAESLRERFGIQDEGDEQ